MQLNPPHYAHCLKMLRQSPLFSSLDDVLLENMLKMFDYETRKK